MPAPWVIPSSFDGTKFSARYSLQPHDFYVIDGLLFLRDSVTIPDDPPIFDPPDSPTIVRRNHAAHIFEDTTIGQVVRALAAVALDEINILRAAVVPALPARTLTQLKNAVLNKINNGTAD